MGRVEKKTLVVVVTLPQFTVEPHTKILARVGTNLRLNCSASGNPQPVVTWKKKGAQLPVGRSQQIEGALIIRNLKLSDTGNYLCSAASAQVFDVETGTYVDVVNKGE